ncbi:PAS domain-containing protein [uncultured Cyclobacterium sp.]|uniref:PAS domain-containing protein n=1 Tax=uncultured Cyclobacterium sp. TaxID=453820 RepID=UPI0030EBE638|tara:strand:+ start:553375 stop:561051 length:7677 start_codon:yes stop_codon:yes gene_type:complete
MGINRKRGDIEFSDSEMGTELDAITSLVEILTGAPVSLIVKIEEGDVWINSCQGMEAKDILHPSSLAEFINDNPNELLLLPDSRKVPKFATNPLVSSSPGIVFYAGVPLTLDGQFWGMLCAIDHIPREVNEKTIDGLQLLAGQVTKLLELEKIQNDHEETKENLENETNRLNNIIEATHVGTYDWDMVKNEVSINEEYLAMVGYKLADLSPITMNTWYDLLHPEDRETADRVLAACFNKEIEFFSTEFRLLHKEGHEVWINDRGKVTKWSEDGKPLRMSGTHTDITKRRNDEIQFQTVSDNIPGVVYRYKRPPVGVDTFELVSNGALQLWGFSGDQVIKNSRLIGDRCHQDDIESLMESIDKSASELSYWMWEYRYNHPDGTIRWHKGTGSPHKLEDGSVVWDSIILDVTKRKKVEEKLENTLYFLKNKIKEQDCIYNISRLDYSWSEIDDLLQNAAILIPSAWEYPKKTFAKITFGNQSYFSLKYKPSELSLSSEYVVHDGKSLVLEVMLPKSTSSDGEVNLTNETNLIDNLVYHLGTYLDQLSSQEALRVSNERVSSLIESIPGVFWETYSGSIKTNYVSPQVIEILGYSEQEWIQGMNFWQDHIYEPDREHVLQVIAENSLSNSDFTVEYRFIKNNGEIIWISDLIKVVVEEGKEPMYRGLMVDITKRKTAEIALKNNEKRFKALIENGRDAIAIFDENGVQKFVSSSITQVLGYSEEEALQLKLIEAVHPSDVELALNKFKSALEAEGVPIEGNVTRSKHKDGSWRWMESTMTNFLHDPNIRGIVDNFRDITEKVQLNEKLAKSEKRYKSLVQAGSDLTNIISADGKYTYVSPNYLQILGYEEKDLLGRSSSLYFHPDDIENVQEDFKDLYSLHKVKGRPFRFKRKDGTYCWLMSTATNLIDDPEINGFVINSVEITGLIEVQEKLKTSEARYRGFYESQTTFVIRTDLEGFITYANTKYMETFDWMFPKNTYSGVNVLDTIYDTEKSKVKTALQKCLNNPGKVFKVEIKKLKQGESFYNTLWDFVVILGTNGKPKEIQCNGIDISERIAFEEELKKSNERFELVMQTDSGSIWDLNPISGNMFLGEGFRKNFGLKIEGQEKNRENFFDSIHPDDVKNYQNKIQYIILNSIEKQWEFKYRLIKSNSEYAHVKEKAVILRDNEGKAYRVVGAIKDVTLEYFYGELEAIEKEFMEGSMNQDAKLADLLLNYLSNLEILFPSMKMAVFKVIGGKIQNFATPSLLDSDDSAIKDFEITLNDEIEIENAFDLFNNEVFISDIKKDKRWDKLVNFVHKIGVSSSCSLPIYNSEGKLDALLINFFESSRKPRDLEAYAIQKSQRILSMVFTKFQYLENLHKSNERFNYVNMATNDAIYDWDYNLDEFHWGEGFYKIFGYNKGEEINKISEWGTFMHPADSKVTDEIWDDFVHSPTETSWQKEYRFRHKSGQYLHIEEISYMIRDESGRPLRMIGVLRDKSDEKEDFYLNEVQYEISKNFKKEVELKAILNAVLKYLSKFSNLLGGEVWLLGKKGIKINFFEGYWADQSQPWLKDEVYKIGSDLAVQVLNAGSFFEANVSDNPSYVDLNPEVNKYVKSILGIPLIQNNLKVGVMLLYVNESITLPKDNKLFFEPIGKLLAGEIKRKQQEEEMRLLFKSAPELLSIIDPCGYFVKVNPSFRKLFGYSDEEMLTKKFEDLIHPEDKELSSRSFSIKEGLLAKNLILRLRTKSGLYRSISWNSSDEFGEEGLVFSFGHDITEMVELQTTLDNASKLSRVGSWQVDLLNDNFYLSSTAKEILGLSQDSSPRWRDILFGFKGDSKELVEKAFNQALEKGASWDYQLPMITAVGNERWVRSIAEAEFSKGKCVRIFGSIQDIHKQKSDEIELAKNNQLLEVISKVIEKFLLVENWKDAIDEVFMLTSKAVVLDRIYYFENHIDAATGTPLFSKKIDWYQEKISNFRENDVFQNIAIADYPQMISVLEKGKVFIAHAKELPDCKLKITLEEGGIFSTLIIPIMINNSFYGFIGFDDCTSERQWTDSEVSFLLTITSNLSAAIQRSNSQLALQHSFKEKNAILDSIGEAFYALDKNFNILFWNQRAEEIIGVSRSVALNNNLFEAVPRLKDSYTHKQMVYAFKNQKDVYFEMFSDVMNIWLDVNMYPSPEGISIFIKDINQEKITLEKIQLSNERFEKIAEATNDAIYDYDIVSNKLFLGVGFKSLFGYDLKSSTQDMEFFQSLIHSEDRERINEKFNHFIKSDDLTNWFEEYRLLTNAGDYAFIMDRAIFIRGKNKKVTRVVGAITDITYKKEYEESLQALNKQMAQHAKELERSNNELEQFAYVASHDLQEPLRMVSNFMGLLERRYADKLDQKAHQYIEFAVDGAKRMRQIILDLLEFSRIGKHEDKLKTLSVMEIVDEVCLLLKKRIRETNATIKYEDLPVIISYKTPLFQVFYNLIGNALKYRNEQENPLIEITAVKEKAYWLFSVIDNGIGIAPESHENVFTIFNRLHGKEKYEGTGMGLAIVKKIIDNFGGEVWVESQKGEGATFKFTLPIMDSELDIEDVNH